ADGTGVAALDVVGPGLVRRRRHTRRDGVVDLIVRGLGGGLRQGALAVKVRGTTKGEVPGVGDGLVIGVGPDASDAQPPAGLNCAAEIVSGLSLLVRPLMALVSQPSTWLAPVLFAGAVRLGAMVSSTSIVCVLVVVLRQGSLAVKVRVTTIGQLPLLLS